MSNLRQIGQGLLMYSNQNKGYVIPSYNLPWVTGATTNVTGGPTQPLDGWASILDRDRLVPSKEQDTNTVFYCPNTYDIEGVKDGQTGTDPAKPRGWTDWPLVFTTVGGDSSPKIATTIPSLGFNKIIRVSYWINAYNPIGSAPASIARSDVFYTGSVGLGPDASGAFITLRKTTGIRRSSAMVVVADGVYMGRQTVNQMGMTNSRVGYRHRGPKGQNTLANVCFADGHVESITGRQFPCALSSTASYVSAGGKTTLEEQKSLNSSGFTVYANPDSAIGLSGF
jgi:prepilin-type processing-associated H-X9-DG protein